MIGMAVRCTFPLNSPPYPIPMPTILATRNTAGTQPSWRNSFVRSFKFMAEKLKLPVLRIRRSPAICHLVTQCSVLGASLQSKPTRPNRTEVTVVKRERQRVKGKLVTSAANLISSRCSHAFVYAPQLLINQHFYQTRICQSTGKIVQQNKGFTMFRYLIFLCASLTLPTMSSTYDTRMCQSKVAIYWKNKSSSHIQMFLPRILTNLFEICAHIMPAFYYQHNALK